MYTKQSQKSFYLHPKLTARQQSVQSTDDEQSIEKLCKGLCDYSKVKYKTEMCKNFSQNGFCRYGKKCRFAHGFHELKKTQVLKKQHYRTKKCHSFWVLGECSYGSRCQFSHYETMENKQILSICKMALCQNDVDASCSRLFTILG